MRNFKIKINDLIIKDLDKILDQNNELNDDDDDLKYIKIRQEIHVTFNYAQTHPSEFF
jgi:hypothetical protein